MKGSEQRYQEEIKAQLVEELGLRNIMEVPRLEKIVINMGVGEAIGNIKTLDNAVADLTQIAGQKAVITRAKKAISNFKLREGMPIGCRVTLRGKRMYEFLDRLIHVALPRVRDFRGVPTRSFDGRGNYTLGMKDQVVFPEIDFGKIEKLRGMNISFVTTATSDAHAQALLTHLGMPFRR
ncbi:MAG: 50S ribosomal protein L5 [Acidobacteria bacterium]|nr:50S ribosomal protein L5 [Acidobacteriota bacterium]MCB9399632.1 50S ribosomal protein L5 [Acidobacteriota bacterium]